MEYYTTIKKNESELCQLYREVFHEIMLAGTSQMEKTTYNSILCNNDNILHICIHMYMHMGILGNRKSNIEDYFEDI